MKQKAKREESIDVGSRKTPLGHKQQRVAMDRLPKATICWYKSAWAEIPFPKAQL